jgi:hypothetical protein
MTRTEQLRLKKILEYKKGYLDALLWIQDQQPYDDELELRIDIYLHKIEELQNKLKGHDE